MIPTRLTIGAASLVLVSALSAKADPAYVASTVNLRAGAGTSNEIVVKIPGGSPVEATNCGDWCEVEWQGKKGFAIATALDRSGRVRAPRTAARPPPRQAAPAPASGVYVEDDMYVPVTPPAAYAAPGYYGYGYGYRYRPYYGWRGRYDYRRRYGYRGRW
jgi:hypothetical protein